MGRSLSADSGANCYWGRCLVRLANSRATWRRCALIGSLVFGLVSLALSWQYHCLTGSITGSPNNLLPPAINNFEAPKIQSDSDSKLVVPFVNNVGQYADEAVRYVATVFKGAVYVKDDAVVYSLLLTVALAQDGDITFGRIAKRPSAEEIQNFIRQCQNGVWNACTTAARYIPQSYADTAKAKELLKLACENNYSLACNQLGELFEKRDNNLTEARKYYLLACEHHRFWEGCDKLSDLEDKAGNKEESKRILELACFHYEQWGGCLKLSDLVKKTKNNELMSNSHNFKANYLHILNEKCKSGKWGSCWELGLFRQKAEELEEAKKPLQLACDHNIQSACIDLEVLEKKIEKETEKQEKR